jgi:catechol 2,3-dioxygenase-like lactoylglutathione lyase family enzyme
MELSFLYVPVPDLPEAVAFYRDVVGLDEAWREGETTVAFRLPGSEVELMVDADPSAPAGLTPGGFFRVDDLDGWLAGRPSVRVVQEPFPMPGGRAASVADPAGNTVYVFEMAENDVAAG